MSILFKHKINWQYAIGEVILIFIGITLAIAFNNWNEERNEKERSKEYVKAIYEDINATIIQLSDNMETLSNQRTGAVRILRSIESGTLMIEDSLLMEKSLLDVILSVDVSRKQSTFDNLLSTGQVEMIRDEDLTDSLIEFYDLYDHHIYHFNQLPHEVRKRARHFAAENVNSYDIEAEWDMTFNRDNFINRIENWFEDEEYKRAVAAVGASSRTNIIYFNEVMKQAQSILSYMEETYPDLLGAQ